MTKLQKTERINPFLVKNEKRMRREVEREFKKIAKKLAKLVELAGLGETKWLFEDILKISVKSMEDVVGVVVKFARKSVKVWQRESNKKYDLWIKFDVLNEWAVKYLRQIDSLHLSLAKWSISRTTEQGIARIIANGTTQWKTPKEIADDILKQVDHGIFSPARAEMISIRELWNAYEFWKYQPMEEFKARTGRQVMKRWQTVNDDRVTPSHMDNQRQWRILLNEAFAGTWDQLAPASNNPRCRCTTLYNVPPE